MGHIVTSKELENIGKNNCHLSSAPSTPPPRQQPHYSLSFQQTGKTRRWQNSIGGSSWSECVQSVNNLLPSPYSEKWLRCLEQLLHNEGPLPESWRIYIAILALCRHEVTWAVRALTFEFISADGDRKWLSGLRFAPKKIRALTSINNILAHRPWLLTPQHIQDLTKGEESWSMSELCQALCLITHFHSFASFLHACLPLPNPPPTHSSTPPPPPPPPISLASSSSQSNSLPLTPRASPAKAVLPSSLPDKLKPLMLPLEAPQTLTITLEVSPTLMIPVEASPALKMSVEKVPSLLVPVEAPPSPPDSQENSEGETDAASSDTSAMDTQMKTPSDPEPKGVSDPLNTVSISSDLPVIVSNNQDKLTGSSKENKTNGSITVGGAKREIQASLQPNKQSRNESNPTRSVSCREETPSSLREFPHLCHEISYSYENFTLPWNFKILDFNWEDHGYCLMTRLLNEMVNLIDDRFGAVKTISHPAWVRGQEGNSYSYRKAVWIYIQSLYGILHESYVYSQIDCYLSQEVKDFIKKCCVRPEALEGKIPGQLLEITDKHPSQLVPLSILIMEARTESGLLYALKAMIPHHS